MRPRTIKVVALTLVLVFAVGTAFGLDVITGGSVTDCIELHLWDDVIGS